MMKDTTKCQVCQVAPIEYTTSITGCRVKHGFCRRCFELLASRPWRQGTDQPDGPVMRQRSKRMA